MNPANFNITRQCGSKRCEKSLRIYEVLREKGLNGKELAKKSMSANNLSARP